MSALFSELVDTFGLIQVTMWAISVFSTLTERLLLFAVCVGVLLLAERGIQFLMAPSKRVIARAGIAFLCFVILYLVFPFSEYPFPVDGYPFPGDYPVPTALAVAAVFGLAAWWKPKWVIVPALLVSFVAVILLNGWSLRNLARRIHANPAVVQFFKGDFNWIELDPTSHTLYAVGHGTRQLLAFDTKAPLKAPRQSPVDVAGSQAFALNLSEQEIYIVNLEKEVLHILDAGTLESKKQYSSIGIVPADVFMAWDAETDSIFIAAEESDNGAPTVLVNRSKGDVTPLEFVAYNVYHDPRKPRLYLSLDEPHELAIYDLKSRSFSAHYPVNGGIIERVVSRPDRREVLVAEPVRMDVLRLDADTLAPKGSFPTVIAVRTLAVDERHNLLFAGSLISNTLQIIDLKTEKPVADFYVGPWLRSIVVDPEAGFAYVSSIEGLFRVDYQSVLNGGDE